jgi:hypothetical protein
MKSVLDKAYAQIPGSEQERDAAIRAELSRLSDRYRQLATTNTQIDYASPVTRFAYVYRYVTSHANLVCSQVSSSKDLRALLNQPSVEVACLGGGPGSDIVGLLKFIEKDSAKVKKLFCQIFDRETAWGETWVRLFQQFEDHVRLIPTFNAFDAAKPESWQKFREYLDADLFTLIYFVSEIYGLRTDAEPFFRHVMENAKSGALFLFVDNNSSQFSDWFDGLAAACGLEVVTFNQGKLGLPWEEEKTDLGDYYKKFPSPKIEADVAWRVMRKK